MSGEDTDGQTSSLVGPRALPPKNKSQQQQPSPGSSMTEDKYNMQHGRRGTCVIINNAKFKQGTADTAGRPRDREESKIDATKMRSLFDELGFDVELKENLRAKDMLTCAQKASSAPGNKDCDCFVMIIMSHAHVDKDISPGYAHQQNYSEVWGVDKPVQLEKIFEEFKSNKTTLNGKPKLFFIQACDKEDDRDEDDVLPVEIEEDGLLESCVRTCLIPKNSDFLYIYSTAPGHYSFRHKEEGAWFSQAVYKVFTEHAHELDVLTMLTRVNGLLAEKSDRPNMKNSDKKQMPYSDSTLTKDLYLTPKH